MTIAVNAYATIKKLLALLACQILVLSLFAQYKPGGKGKGRMDGMNIRSANASVMVRPLETFGHKISISNTSEDPMKFRFVLQPNPYFRQVNSQETSYFLNSGDSIQLGFKLLNLNARVNGIYTVFFEMINEFDTLDRKLVEFNVEVYDGIDRQFIIQNLADNIMIRSNIREFDVPVLFRNLLHEPKEVLFEVQNPQNNPVQLAEQYHRKLLLPATDTVIHIHFVVNDRIQDLWNFNNALTVYVKNSQGEMLGMFSATPRWLFSKGNFYNPLLGTQPDNTLEGEYNYNYYGGGSYSHDFRLSKFLRQEDNGVGFNVFYQQYGPMQFRTLSGSYIRYKGENVSAMAGNLTDFHELSLYGRGIKAAINFDEDKLNQFEVWAVDQEANLLRPMDLNIGPKTISARFNSRDEEDTRRLAVSSSYFIRPESNSKGHLHFADAQWKFSENESLTATVGGSMERFSHLTGDSTLPGYMVKMAYSKYTPKWRYFVTLIKGSRDYSGLSQGTTVISGQAGYTIDDSRSVSMIFNRSIMDRPAYTPQAITGRFYYNYTSQEILFTKLYKKLELTFKPYYLKQAQLFSFDPIFTRPASGTAIRVQGSINGHWKELHYRLTADAGQFTARNSQNEHTGIRSVQVNTALSLKGITLSGSMQNGPYFISDLANLKDQAKGYFNKSLMLTYGHVFKNKVEWSASAALSENANIKGLIYNLNQELHIDLGKGFKINNSFYLYKYTTIKPNFQVRTGVVKTFNWDKSENARVKVTVQVFEDLNNNGIKEPEENWAKETMVRFDGMILLSDAEGKVVVSNVSKDFHKISIMYGNTQQQNYYDRTDRYDRNTKVMVGVPPQFTITGKVQAPEKKYDETKVEMEGVKVLFIDRNGKEFTAFTDNAGQFRIQLPAGTYKAFLPELKSRNRGGEQSVKVDIQKGAPDPLLFKWVEEGRQVQVKKL